MANVIIEETIYNQNKPSDSAFKQQKLPAWQPILTASTVLPTFFFIGIAFVPIGIGLLFSSNSVQEKIIDYTYCKNDKNQSCADLILNGSPCICSIEFNLEQEIKGEVFIYYGLTNYYQNHRRYVKSRDDKQLLGNTKDALSSDCEPFAYSDGKKIAPCGAIANSLFNDTFSMEHFVTQEIQKWRAIRFLKTGIAWATDKSVKFRNPPGELNGDDAFRDTIPPPNWKKPVWLLSADSNNNGYLNEDLIVWMRTAALSTFRKLYARIDHSSDLLYYHSLPQGSYKITITYQYPVTSFKGTKKIIISNTSWLGGKNNFLGIAYIAVGCLCLMLSGLFLFIHRKFGKSVNEMINIDQRTPYLDS